MRKYRFGLSDMVPNSWFCKLKGMVTGGRRRSRGQQAQNSKKKSQAPKTAERKSSETQRVGFALPAPSPKQIFLANRSSNYVASRERAEMLPQCLTPQKVADAIFPLDTPRKTKPKPCKKHPSYSINPLQSPVSSLSACSFPNAEFQFDACEAVSTAECRIAPSQGNEMNIDVFNVVAERSLHPIATKPERKEPNKRALLATKLSSKQGNVRNASPGLHKIKIRAHSPRLAKRVPRKGLTQSYVMVKTSTNPQKDFMESMVEMIVENNLLSSKDLEELLACYLSLNSKEYHDMIVKVFEQIWLALA